MTPSNSFQKWATCKRTFLLYDVRRQFNCGNPTDFSGIKCECDTRRNQDVCELLFPSQNNTVIKENLQVDQSTESRPTGHADHLANPKNSQKENMKSNKVLLSLTALALAAWVTGCKEETTSVVETTKETTKTVAEQTTDAVKTATDAVKDTGAKVVEEVKAAGTTAVAAVSDKAKEMAAPVNTKAQELIDSAKSLIGEGKFADALAKLNATSGETMSTNQVSMVDSLKAQIAKATESAGKVVGDATKSVTDAVSNLLKK